MLGRSIDQMLAIERAGRQAKGQSGQMAKGKGTGQNA